MDLIRPLLPLLSLVLRIESIKNYNMAFNANPEPDLQACLTCKSGSWWTWFLLNGSFQRGWDIRTSSDRLKAPYAQSPLLEREVLAIIESFPLGNREPLSCQRFGGLFAAGLLTFLLGTVTFQANGLHGWKKEPSHSSQSHCFKLSPLWWNHSKVSWPHDPPSIRWSFDCAVHLVSNRTDQSKALW